MTNVIKLGCYLSLTFLVSIVSSGQPDKKNSLIYVDKNGTIRGTKDNKEVSFFGVNYTTPFAYAYRAHKALGVDLERAIQQDVYHLARLGLDAFRVHVWDNEISDVKGNLLENDHLRLYDFLLAELKKRNIKTIITPIAFWGNGYPERDEDTPGFSRFYGRGKLTTNDSAIMAQENYLRQFFKHVNPYTKLSYQDDPDVIAVEINNEPAHSGPKKDVTEYINRLANAIKSTGWSKPVFYNISQGPYYADAVAASVVDGYSFQWYPSGLVSGNELKGNYLPNVDKYTIPFDSIPTFKSKALMVYEFDAADILQSCMYPAMARSFREAGMGWATQFAYDPMAIAYGNTEYQTHYLNLAYTPSKAISLLIASKVFHRVPRFKDFGSYPADSVFDIFRVSYKESLSEMNDAQEFYYSNNTSTSPKDVSKLKHVAGVGRSPLVDYNGAGAYFLDKLETGVWRLEVMPDAVYIRDPFEKASPKKEVTRIEWNEHGMKINIPELGSDFEIKGLNEGNANFFKASSNRFVINPGTYLLSKTGKKPSIDKYDLGIIKLNEFVAPKSFSSEIYLRHEPYREVSAGRYLSIEATIVGLDSGNVNLLVNQLGGRFKSIPMTKITANNYHAVIPQDMITPGMLNYRIMIKSGKEYSLFPGNIKENPFDWDSYHFESWSVFVAAPNSNLEIFNPINDKSFRTYPVWRRGFLVSYTSSGKPNQLLLRLSATDLNGVDRVGFQYSFVDKVKGRLSELDMFKSVVVNAKASSDKPVQATVTLVNVDGKSISSAITLTDEMRAIEVPLTQFASGASLLMPRPYPGFLPLTFNGGIVRGEFKLSSAEKVEITVSDLSDVQKAVPFELIIESIQLNK